MTKKPVPRIDRLGALKGSSNRDEYSFWFSSDHVFKSNQYYSTTVDD